MEIVRFIFLLALKTLGLIFLGLLASKAVSGINAGQTGNRLTWLQRGAHGLIVGLAVLNAYNLGNDIAAANYAWTSQADLVHMQLGKAYSNAQRAVELRPGITAYWEALADAKFAQRQYASLVADLPAFLSLGAGKLNEEVGFRLASSYFLLAQYDKAIPLTEQMIKSNPSYAAPYVLQGYSHLAQRKFPEAERAFLGVLQKYPDQRAAVEGLSHVYFLTGNKASALDVLAQTAKQAYPDEARQRFESLRALYAQ